MSRVFDGAKLANIIKRNIQKEIQGYNSKTPSLHIISVGNDGASDSFILRKGAFAEQCGVHIHVHSLKKSPKLSFIRHLIQELNDNPNVHGILTQLPLRVEDRPYWEICNLVDPLKDVDALNQKNIVRLSRGQLNKDLSPLEQDFFLPAASLALDETLKTIDFNPRGKLSVVIGDGPLIGNPIADFLTYFHKSTVIRCNEYTPNIEKIISESDLVISGVGKASYLKGDWIKDDAVVIDFGCSFTQKDQKKKVLGDVEFDKAREKAKLITPVPNGMGPVTVAMLMLNLCKSFKSQTLYHR